MSYHDDMREEAIAVMEESIAWRKVTQDALWNLETGFYDIDYVDMILQHHTRERITLTDAYWFLQIHTLLGHGDVVFGRWSLGAAPHADAAISANTAILARLHSRTPLTAVYQPRRGAVGDIGDGTISWRAPLLLGQRLVDGQVFEHTCSPRSVPLEVGTTRSTTTMLHLQREGGVARWPYGNSWLSILVRSNRSKGDSIDEVDEE